MLLLTDYKAFLQSPKVATVQLQILLVVIRKQKNTTNNNNFRSTPHTWKVEGVKNQPLKPSEIHHFSLKSGFYNSISSSTHPDVPKLLYSPGDITVCCASENVSVCGWKAAPRLDCLAWHPSVPCCL